MHPKINLFIVDDHHVVREGIISLIRENETLVVLGEASNGVEALAEMDALETLPDVVLMDIIMPVMDGVACTKEIYTRFKENVKVLAFTMVNQNLYIRNILKAGALGYILKNCDKIELFKAIDTVYRGASYFGKDVTQAVMGQLVKIDTPNPSAPEARITKREQEVLEIIVKGRSNQEIADALHISIRTVETHKQNLIAKTGANNIAGLVVYAIKSQLVDIP